MAEMLCENYVNSVKLLASKVEDNTEPSKNINILEGVTTSRKTYIQADGSA